MCSFTSGEFTGKFFEVNLIGVFPERSSHSFRYIRCRKIRRTQNKIYIYLSILISATAILSGRGSRAFVTIRFVVALSTRSRRRAKLSPVVTASRDRVFGRRRFVRGKASKRAKREIIRVRMLASAIDFEYAQPRSCTIPLLACFLAQLQAFGRV